MRLRTILLALTLAASVSLAGAADVTTPPTIVVEGGSITALNSDLDLGLSVSVGTTLPKWVPVVGEHLAFVDMLTVSG